MVNIAAGRQCPEVYVCVVRMMSTSRESPPPQTHSKHSTLEKVRGHIVSIRQDCVSHTHIHTEHKWHKTPSSCNPMHFIICCSYCHELMTIRRRRSTESGWGPGWGHISSKVCPDSGWFGVHCQRRIIKRISADEIYRNYKERWASSTATSVFFARVYPRERLEIIRRREIFYWVELKLGFEIICWSKVTVQSDVIYVRLSL